MPIHDATVSVPDEQLRVGDMINVLGWKRITSIAPYQGPLRDIVFAIALTVPGGGFSLCYGQETETCRPGPVGENK